MFLLTASLLFSTAFGKPIRNNHCLEFLDDFSVLDTKVWQHDVTLGGGGNWEFEWFLSNNNRYSNNRTTSYVEDGILYLMPMLTAEYMGVDKMLNGGNIDLWASGCTNNGWYLYHFKIGMVANVSQMDPT